MIPEYRRAAVKKGHHWAIRLRLLLLIPGSHKWNGWVRDATAKLEGFKSYDDEKTDAPTD